MTTEIATDLDLISIAAAISFALKYEQETISKTDGTQSTHTRESVWYSPYFLVLRRLLQNFPLLTIAPQRTIYRVLHSESKQAHVVNYRIPDFVISAQQYKTCQWKKTGIQIEPTLSEVVMLVEIKAMPSKESRLDVVKKLAWDQASTQATYVFADCMKTRTQDKNALCLMVCVGIEWSYLIRENPAAGEITINTDPSYDEFCRGLQSNSSFLTNEDPDSSASSESLGDDVPNIVEHFLQEQGGLRQPNRRRAALASRAAVAKIFLQEDLSDSAVINGRELELDEHGSEGSRVDSNNDEVSNAEQDTEEEVHSGIGEGVQLLAFPTRLEDVRLPAFSKLGTKESENRFKKMRGDLQRLPGFNKDGWTTCLDPTEKHAEIMRSLTSSDEICFDFIENS